MLLKMVIVGRPNVGKSTLFNRLVGKRSAITNDMPGVTRDRREGEGHINGLDFLVVDTAGFDESIENDLDKEIKIQTTKAVENADLALLVLDAKIGLTPLDQTFANWIRKYSLPVTVVANKCDGNISYSILTEAHTLGFGSPIAISAEHGEGILELFDVIKPLSNKLLSENQDVAHYINHEQNGKNFVTQIAIVGRPNVGKSTLFNKLIGEKRTITGEKAGITRDSIGVSFKYQGHSIKIFDTAGLRKKARVIDKVENISSADTYRAIQFSQIVILVLDPKALLEKQDLTIARNVIDEGRGLLLAINKWDTIKNPEELLRELENKLAHSLPQISGLTILPLSALTGYNVDKLLPKVCAIFTNWNLRISTGKLNRWLKETLERHPPPLNRNGKRFSIRYVTQVKSRPPTFNFFSSNIDKLPPHYFRYLKNSLQAQFKINGVPLRLKAQKNKNPYN